MDIYLKLVPGPQTMNSGMLKGGEKSRFFDLEKFGKKRFFVKILIHVVSGVRHIERYHSTDKIHSFSEWFCFFYIFL